MNFKVLGKSKGLLWALFILNLGSVVYLVWTPASSIDCSANTLFIKGVFCLPTWLNLAGNLLLLAPTAMFLASIFPGWPPTRIYICVTVFSGVIELTQSNVPGRDPSVMDFIQNSLGAIAVLKFCLRKYARKN